MRFLKSIGLLEALLKISDDLGEIALPDHRIPLLARPRMEKLVEVKIFKEIFKAETLVIHVARSAEHTALEW